MNNSQPRCSTLWFGLQKWQELGDKAIEQPEMLLTSKGQKQLPLVGQTEMKKTAEEVIKGEEGMRNSPTPMDT